MPKPPATAAAGEDRGSSERPAKYRFDYFTPRPKYWAYDGLPFVGVYGAVLAAVAAADVQRGEFVLEHLLWALLPATLHLLLFLATQWSVKARCFVRFRAELDLGRATHVRVLPLVRGEGKSYPTLLVPLERQGEELSIQYQKKRFVYSAASGTFERLRFDIAAALGHYAGSGGLSGEAVAEVRRRFGSNMYDIPLPSFGELFQEHAVAPFFVFQVLCVLLWLMDEYWYYALLTLVMLIILEVQMVNKRLHDLSELRAMRIPPRPMHVHRDAAWRVVMSDALLPGDIVAVCRAPDASFPCDVLLLQGSVLANEAMLTGESVPQMKVAVSHNPGSPELLAPLDMKGVHKQHVVSAGTNIMLHQNAAKIAGGAIKKVPLVGGQPAAVGYVLRTGFDTTQGKLCRTILFSAERVTVQSREAFHFILILLAFALGACGYVLYDGLVLAAERPEETPRSTFKLLLSVSHIITSVVPPEFPIMLSLAVNLCLVALVRKRIYCTEPFRVPLAGRIETCCFDKTGTLTSDSMQVGGVYGLPSSSPVTALRAAGEEADGREGNGVLSQPLPFLTTAVMASCSGLTVVEQEVVGDPLERAALQAVGWFMAKPDVVVSKRLAKGADRLEVLHRFPFVSELQRMAVLVKHTGPGTGHLQEAAGGRDLDRWLALVKGSCEALRPRLREVPESFDSLQRDLTKAGFRVLCLAAKEVTGDRARDPEEIPRADLESDLEFCGVLALRNAIKSQVSTTIRKLRKSYHRVVMITGDNPMTACQVAIQVSMADGKFLLLEVAAGVTPSAGAAALEWRSRDDPSKAPKPFSIAKVKELARKHTLCVAGWALARLSPEELLALVPFVTVFARVSPQQKELVVTTLNKESHTVMVGDGTNDVGALKHAHVGISLLTTAPVMSPPRGAPGQPDFDDGRAPLVRLGDASIASPFTYKGDSIKCSLDILRSGRATLSTVLMMYKIMGLNSVVSAFAMSVLTLDGVKFGDFQTTVESLYTSMLFFMVSRSLPAKELAKQRPSGSVFAWHVMLSLALQLAVHLYVLLRGWMLATSFRPKDFKRDLEADFEPNLTNSVVFLLIASMHVSSFVANYEGYPFMQSMRTNKPLFYSILLFVAVVFMAGAELLPELNEGLSLVAFPTHEFRGDILWLLGLDFGLSVAFAHGLQALAVHLGGRAAERRAREWNLGMASDSAEKESKAAKKSK